MTASQQQLLEQSNLSVNIRKQYPGFCAFDFEEKLDIVLEHLLGWDLDLEQSKDGGGAFGGLEAWFGAVEEQGRKTLHIHF